MAPDLYRKKKRNGDKLNVISYGLKHKGHAYEDVLRTDPDYCCWAMEQRAPCGGLHDFQQWLSPRRAHCVEKKKTSCRCAVSKQTKRDKAELEKLRRDHADLQRAHADLRRRMDVLKAGARPAVAALPARTLQQPVKMEPKPMVHNAGSQRGGKKVPVPLPLGEDPEDGYIYPYWTDAMQDRLSV